MTARIVGFVTRAQAGLRKPRSVSHNITPATGGVAVHYGGSGGPPSTHAGCLARWKAWQDYHMDGHGWADIAYNFGYCNHGFAFAGRGLGVRSAAQGTNDGNQRYYAAVWIGGGTAIPTKAAVDALEWIIATARKGGAGRGVRPHRSFHSTSCPGAYLTAVAKRLDGTTLTSTTQEDEMPLTDDDVDRIADRTAEKNWEYLLSVPGNEKRQSAGSQLSKANVFSYRVLLATDVDKIATAVAAKIPAAGDLTAEAIQAAAAAGMREVLGSLDEEES